MKKFIIILTVLAMVVSLFAGCGSSGDKDISGSISKEPVEPAAPEQEKEAEFETGVVIGGTYSNEFLGINLTLDDNWIFYNHEQIAEINGLVADQFSDEDLKDMLETNGSLMDLYASTFDSNCNINMAIENVGLLTGSILSEEAYMDLSLDTLLATYESAGFTNVSTNIITVDFCGSDHYAIEASSINPYGYEIYQLAVAYKAGRYMAVITVTGPDRDTAYSMLDYFYAGDPVYTAPEAPADSEFTAEPSVPSEPVATDIFTAGTINGNNYKNAFFGYECQLDSNWYMYTPAELAEYNMLDGDVYGTQQALELMALGDAPYLMSALTYDENCYLELIVEDLGVIYGATLTAEDYVDMTLSDVRDSFAAELDTSVCEKAFVNLGGQQHPAIVISGSLSGVDLYQTMICVKSGNYIFCVSILCLYEDACDIIASYFRPIG